MHYALWTLDEYRNIWRIFNNQNSNYPWRFENAGEHRLLVVDYSLFVVNKFLFDYNFRLDNIFENDERNGENLGTALEQALKEATDDETFRKVKRMSYSSSAAEEVSTWMEQSISANRFMIN